MRKGKGSREQETKSSQCVQKYDIRSINLFELQETPLNFSEYAVSSQERIIVGGMLNLVYRSMNVNNGSIIIIPLPTGNIRHGSRPFWSVYILG